MFKFTQITRLADAQPLAASMEPNFDGRALEKYKVMSKALMKEFSQAAPSERLMTIDANGNNFHVLVEQGVVFLTCCEPRSVVAPIFSFLEDLGKEFLSLHGNEFEKCDRPYAFIKFDGFLQKTKKVYSADSRNVKLPGGQTPARHHISRWLPNEAPPKASGPSPVVIAGGVLAFLIIVALIFFFSFGN